MELSPLSQLIPSFGSPTLEGFDTSNIQDGQRIKGSARQYVRFYTKTFSVPAAKEIKVNEKTGNVKVLKTEMVEKTCEMVHIKTPGDKNEVDGIAEEYHKREHFQYYKAFRSGTTAPVGTDLDECAFVPSAIALELKYLGCHTVEQLADASDLLCGRIAQGYELREFAKAHVKAQIANASSGQVRLLKNELDKSQALIAEMQKQMSEMKAMIFDQHGQPAESKKSKKKEEATE